MPIDVILDVVIIIFGFYVIYLGVSMHKKQKISETIMVEQEIKKIKNPKGFIEFVYPRFVFFGATVSVISTVSLVSDTLIKIPYWTAIQLGLFLIVLLFFSQQFKEAKSRFSKSWSK